MASVPLLPDKSDQLVTLVLVTLVTKSAQQVTLVSKNNSEQVVPLTSKSGKLTTVLWHVWQARKICQARVLSG